MSGIFGRRNKNSLKKQDIVGGVRVWSIIYMINFHGTLPTMCRIISSKNKKINEKTRHRLCKRDSKCQEYM